ncbi:hypothetical protein HHK36_019722 [Tetracentron sinense]|uniref:Uncharacterized protein n=1 Tax=Tetracentron sinense TaxID=13715 RepID=A0A834YZL4_TETSI|nr:hypothetical protein HHK36_019722 [Tetracentron sinense]
MFQGRPDHRKTENLLPKQLGFSQIKRLAVASFGYCGRFWKPSVPSWVKKFCFLVGSIRWRKLLETRKEMSSNENVAQWNDSAGEEAFQNAKNRFWAEINGLPYDVSVPNQDIYIDEVDWNSEIDPDLLLDLDKKKNSGSW